MWCAVRCVLPTSMVCLHHKSHLNMISTRATMMNTTNSQELRSWGKRPHPNPLPEGEGIAFNCVSPNSNFRLGSSHGARGPRPAGCLGIVRPILRRQRPARPVHLSRNSCGALTAFDSISHKTLTYAATGRVMPIHLKLQGFLPAGLILDRGPLPAESLVPQKSREYHVPPVCCSCAATDYERAGGV